MPEADVTDNNRNPTDMLAFINNKLQINTLQIKKKCYLTCHYKFITWDIIPSYIQF